MTNLTITLKVNSPLEATRLVHIMQVVSVRGMEVSAEVDELVSRLEGTPITAINISEVNNNEA